MKVVLVCKYCSKSYTRRKSKAKRSKYCSKSCGLLYRWRNSEERLKLERARSLSWNKKRRKEHSKMLKKRYAKNPNLKKILSLNLHKNWKNPEFRKKSIRFGEKNPFFGKKHSRKLKNFLRKLANKQWRDDKLRKRNSEISVGYWQSIDYQKKQVISRSLRPNKIELRLNKILNENFPNEYKYVGDFQFWLGGKNPDFMNVNGQKKLIELYGSYWHKDDNPRNRINHFKKYGFDTLIIWDKELKNIPKLEKKLEIFHNK